MPPPAPGPKTLRLCALTPSGRVRWTAPTINEIFNAPLRIGPDGALWAFDGLPAQVWTPLTSAAGRPLPLAEQRRRTSPQQPLPGGQRLTATQAARGGEWLLTLAGQAGRPLRGWRVTSQTDLGALGATPALVGGDPVVVIEVSRQTAAKFLFEYQVLRLARGGGASVRFAINPSGRAMWGSESITGVRVGPDGQLYQLRTDRSTGISIARYSLGPTQPTPPTAPAPTPTPAPGPPIDHGGLTPPVTAPPAQPATPAADPATSKWLLPSLLAGLGIWLLYRRRHPASQGLHGRSPMAR